eukprot:scaffold233308_cov26-Tisochrysis_lutea.AAC.2
MGGSWDSIPGRPARRRRLPRRRSGRLAGCPEAQQLAAAPQRVRVRLATGQRARARRWLCCRKRGRAARPPSPPSRAGAGAPPPTARRARTLQEPRCTQ